MRPTAAVAAALLVGALSACGGEGGGRFDDDVAAIREAVEQGDPDAATQAIDALAVDALAAHEDGVIDDAELQEVAELVEASRAELAQVLPTTTTTTTTTTTEPPPPPVDDDDGDDKEDKDDGKGKGKGRGDD